MADKKPPAAGADDKPAAKEKKAISQATRLCELASGQSFWHTPDGVAFATIEINGHAEHCPVRSSSFRRWLQRRFFAHCGGAAGAQGVQDALGVIEARALFDGAEHPVFVRVAGHDGTVYIDLCNPSWQAVEVGGDGWRIVSNPAVRFRRAKAMLSLPTPERGGSVSDLRRFINVADGDWPLILGWLIAAIFPRGPYPLLCFSAEQGSGKSTTARVIRSLVDPNSAPLRSEPREPRDLMIAANNGWLVALDNLSYLPAWLSDCLCRLSTGGGFSTRTLYENDEETIFDAMRPAIVNGIEDIITRGDLLDRAIILTLPTIAEDHRRAESDFWADFDAARPRICGALLDALSTAIGNLPSVKLPRLPRMADFALLATAAEPGLGLERGAFLAAYTGNVSDANSLALDGNPIARHVVELATAGPWQGTPSDLLAELNGRADEKEQRQRGWPKSARAVSGLITRLAPNLRRAGIAVEHWREPGGNRRRIISLRKQGETTVPTVPEVDGQENCRVFSGPDGTVGTVAGRTRDAKEPERDGRDGRDAKIPVRSNGTHQLRLTI